MSRIDMNDTVPAAMLAMSEGVFGAAAVLTQLYEINIEVDPDSAFGSFSAIRRLDELGIYGPHIWILYKDVCGQNAALLIAVLRSVQQGLVSDQLVKQASFRVPPGALKMFDPKELYLQLKEKLPSFDPCNHAGIS